jgi:SAM-dependent methyltransferase
MTSHTCQICNNPNHNRLITAREMMFGTGDVFEYLECSACGCLQLLDVPQDLSRFYPDNYYAFGDVTTAVDGPLASAIKKSRTNLLLRLPVGVVDALVRAKRIPAPFMWLAGLGLTTSSLVCDLGSGSGETLVWMLQQGFSHLSGFDPYVHETRDIDGQIAVRKLGVDDMPGGWDLIMLNHSFEHMPEPALVLQHLRNRLNPQGSIIIRVPVADSWAWRTYGADWVQLDAPRHLFIHTQRSMRIVALSAGLTITRVFFDSNALQIWGSEQYKKNIPLRDPLSYAENPQTAVFTTSEIRDFERCAAKLNRARLGDSIGFVLRAFDASTHLGSPAAHAEGAAQLPSSSGPVNWHSTNER